MVPVGTLGELDTVLPGRLQTKDDTLLANVPTSTTDDIPHTETAARTLGPHLVGSPDATSTKTPQNALGSKRVGNTNDMTTTTPTGNHGGAVMSCSQYAHPGFAEICTCIELGPQRSLAHYELAYLIKKKTAFAQRPACQKPVAHRAPLILEPLEDSPQNPQIPFQRPTCGGKGGHQPWEVIEAPQC